MFTIIVILTSTIAFSSKLLTYHETKFQLNKKREQGMGGREREGETDWRRDGPSVRDIVRVCQAI
jgi:hypothetical protein